MDINAAVGSELNISNAKLLALKQFRDSSLFDAAEIAALTYADAITLSGSDVTDDLFLQLRVYYNDDQILELTAAIAWENASSKFNRALRIPSQNLWDLEDKT